MSRANHTGQRGPTGYELWKAHSAGQPLRSVVEFTLYSDAHITSEIREGLGPFAVLNTIAAAASKRLGEPLPSMVLRCHIHGSDEGPVPDLSRRDDSRWHAGSVDDELAALLSLALGIRIRSGGFTREFTGQDPLGTPRLYAHEPPYLPPPAHRSMLPSATGTHRIDSAVDLVATYPSLTPEAAITLVRAARAYQEGIWVVEEDPEYTWLKLVSAVEAAADHWWQGDADPVELLDAWDEDLSRDLHEAGGPELVAQVAARLTPVTQATKKFLSFLDEHLPEPPDLRPTTNQIDWSTISKKELRLVYKYRSESLHGGKPFPGPLLFAPIHPTEVEERPLGLSSAVGDSVWTAADLPMHLYVFEYIVRGALHTWWQRIDTGGA